MGVCSFIKFLPMRSAWYTCSVHRKRPGSPPHPHSRCCACQPTSSHPRNHRPWPPRASQDTPSSLPQTYEVALEEWQPSLHALSGRTRAVVIGVRSDAPQLQDGWVYVTAVSQRTQMETWHAFVALQPDRDGILTGTSVLSTALDPGQGYEISCDPIPALRGHTE